MFFNTLLLVTVVVSVTLSVKMARLFKTGAVNCAASGTLRDRRRASRRRPFDGVNHHQQLDDDDDAIEKVDQLRLYKAHEGLRSKRLGQVRSSKTSFWPKIGRQSIDDKK